MSSPDRASRATFSRRHLLGLLALTGGGTLLAACQSPDLGTALAVSSNTPRVITSTISAAERPHSSGTAQAPAGTVTRSAPATSAATGTPFARMTALLPQQENFPGANGIWYADIATQKRNYGLAEITNLDAATAHFKANPIAQANNALGALPLPALSGYQQALTGQWRETTGYDFWQIDRAIMVGDPPQTLTILEGAFDLSLIAAKLTAAGHQPQTIEGQTIFARGADGAIGDINVPLTRLTLSGLNRVLLRDRTLIASAFTGPVAAHVTVRQKSSLAADPDHAALIAALGPVVGAILAPPQSAYSSRYRLSTPATPVREAQLHSYRRLGLGLRDDGTTHTMLIALAYTTRGEAEDDAPVLQQRARGYRLASTGQLLRERATPGEPAIIPFGDRTVLLLPLAITDRNNLGLWLQLFTRRDYLFLGD